MAHKLNGHLDAFTLDDDFDDYIDLFECLMLTNGVDDEPTKLALFLELIGPVLLGILNVLHDPITQLHPTHPFTYYDALVVLHKHFGTKLNSVTARLYFARRRQLPGETVHQYGEALRAMALPCEFGGCLELAVRDRFVGGVQSAEVREQLAAEPGITMTRAMQIAQCMESEVECQVETIKLFEEEMRQMQRVKLTAARKAKDDGEIRYMEWLRARPSPGSGVTFVAERRGKGDERRRAKDRGRHANVQELLPREGSLHRGRPISKTVCFRCDQVGHLAKECPIRPHHPQQQQDAAEGGI